LQVLPRYIHAEYITGFQFQLAVDEIFLSTPLSWLTFFIKEADIDVANDALSYFKVTTPLLAGLAANTCAST
jgi:hypothetical protein